MKFLETSLRGCFVIEPERYTDDRGHFARSFDRAQFRSHGLEDDVVQMNVSYTRHARTLRGIHYQLPPNAETKLVRCPRGEIVDVALDLRSDSDTFGQSISVTLSAENGLMLFVPRGFGHGFMSVTDDVEVTYAVSATHSATAERGIRFDDPKFRVSWPFAPEVISEKDRNWPLFDENFHQVSQFATK